MDTLPDQPGFRPPRASRDADLGEQALPAAPHGVPLGQLLVERHLVTQEQLVIALADHKQTGKPLGRVMVDLGFVDEAMVAQALATQHGGMLKTEYGFATAFGENERPGLLPMIEPLVSPEMPADAGAAEKSKRPTIGAGLPPPTPLSLAPVGPVVVGELPAGTAVFTELFEARGAADAAEPGADSVGQNPAGKQPAAAVVPDADGDFGGEEANDPEAEVEESADLLTRVVELEATIEASVDTLDADESRRPTIVDLATLTAPSPNPVEHVAVEEPQLGEAVAAELFEDQDAPVAGAELDADDGASEPPAVVVVAVPDVDSDADPAEKPEAEVEGTAELLARVAEKLLTRVAALEATIEAVRLAAETAAAEAASARADAKNAVERVGWLDDGLAAAREPEQALRAELERLAAAAAESLTDRELQEKLVRARLVELERQLDASSPAQA